MIKMIAQTNGCQPDNPFKMHVHTHFLHILPIKVGLLPLQKSVTACTVGTLKCSRSRPGCASVDSDACRLHLSLETNEQHIGDYRRPRKGLTA